MSTVLFMYYFQGDGSNVVPLASDYVETQYGTSLILSWDNPFSLFNPGAHACHVWRQSGTMKGVCVTTDATWGFYRDTENANPDAKYTIIYVDRYGSQIDRVEDIDIVRYRTPDNICKVVFQCTKPDGSPDSGKQIVISNEAGGSGEWSKSIITNVGGFAVFYVMPNNRVLIRIDGQMKALDVAIPNVRKLTYEDLVDYGSLVDIDPRRSIGWEP